MLGFLARFALVYAVFLAPVVGPAIESTYRVVLRTTCDVVVGLPFRLVTGGGVDFSAYQRGDELRDTKILVRDPAVATPAVVPLNTHGKAYLPLALLVALVLATPIPWRRRGRALAWGIVLLHVVLALRILLMLVATTSREAALPMLDLGEGVDEVLGVATSALYRSYLVSFAIPMLVWIAVCFTRDDLARLAPGRVAR